MGLVTPCNSVFQITLPAPSGANAAVDNITINAHLTPATEYWYIVTDKFGNEYTKQVTADENGSFELLAADFPTGLFNPYSGKFQLQVKKTLQDEAPQPLTFCAEAYDTILMAFANVTANVPNSIIDCH
ncbi:MAG TPA: hypothetical protein VFE32_17360 [Puia sp.]|jgi:hypothetical protein|nr:hypothetical protein [Puia sp.]